MFGERARTHTKQNMSRKVNIKTNHGTNTIVISISGVPKFAITSRTDICVETSTQSTYSIQDCQPDNTENGAPDPHIQR